MNEFEIIFEVIIVTFSIIGFILTIIFTSDFEKDELNNIFPSRIKKDECEMYSMIKRQ